MKFRNLLAMLALVTGVGAAQATYTVNIVQNGANVVMTGSGSIDTTGMTLSVTNSSCANGLITPTALCIGTAPAGLIGTGIASSVTGLTSGAGTSADAATGSPVYAVGNTLYLPAGYVSLSPISSSSTFNGKTLATLGLTAGTTKTITLTSGDTIVVTTGTVAPATVPTLSEYAMAVLAAAMAMLGLVAMRRKMS